MCSSRAALYKPFRVEFNLLGLKSVPIAFPPVNRAGGRAQVRAAARPVVIRLRKYSLFHPEPGGTAPANTISSPDAEYLVDSITATCSLRIICCSWTSASRHREPSRESGGGSDLRERGVRVWSCRNVGDVACILTDGDRYAFAIAVRIRAQATSRVVRCNGNRCSDALKRFTRHGDAQLMQVSVKMPALHLAYENSASDLRGAPAPPLPRLSATGYIEMRTRSGDGNIAFDPAAGDGHARVVNA